MLHNYQEIVTEINPYQNRYPEMRKPGLMVFIVVKIDPNLCCILFALKFRPSRNNYGLTSEWWLCWGLQSALSRQRGLFPIKSKDFARMCFWGTSHDSIRMCHSRGWGEFFKKNLLKEYRFFSKDNYLQKNLYEDAASEQIFTQQSENSPFLVCESLT